MVPETINTNEDGVVCLIFKNGGIHEVKVDSCVVRLTFVL